MTSRRGCTRRVKRRHLVGLWCAAFAAAFGLGTSAPGFALGPTSTTSTSSPDPSSTTTTDRGPTTTLGPTSSTSSTTSTTSTTAPGLPPEELDADHHEHDALGEDFADQLDFDPATRDVVSAEFAAARLALDAMETHHAISLLHIEQLEEDLDEIEASIDELDADRRRALRAVDSKRGRFEEAAIESYIRGSDLDQEVIFEASTVGAFLERLVIVELVLATEYETIEEHLEQRAALGDEATSLIDGRARVTRELKDARLLEKQRRVDLAEARVQSAVWQAGSQVIAQGFVFPVFGPVQFGDSWGAPRMSGTERAHWHEGTDVMAAAGTPLVATENGRITSVRSHDLGGKGITMVGASGLQYYYAHLSDYAPGLAPGAVVTAGEVIGYVGDTGNAKGTPHLHFEIVHEGQNVNPFPILQVTWEWQGPHILAAAQDLAALDAGFAPPSDAAIDADLSPDE